MTRMRLLIEVIVLEFREDSYCGLFCGACDSLLSTREGTLEDLAEGSRYSPQELFCQGCKSSATNVFCKKCSIRQCAQEKKLEFCYMCAEYPCEKLKCFRSDSHPHHSVVLRNLRSISSMGARKWLEQQRIRWQCSSCSRRFSWYEEVCKNCGAKLFNCVSEDKTLSENDHQAPIG